MKQWLAAVLILACVSPDAFAQAELPRSGWHGTLGAGPLVTARHMGGKDRDVLPVPLAFVDYNDWFYVNLFRAGAYVWSSADKKTGISLALEPRLGFSASDGARLAGMATRRGSVMGGPTFDQEWSFGALSLGYFTDLNGASDGGYFDVLFSKPLVASGRWKLDGTIEVTRLDSKLVDYYFGVTPAEATPARPAYQPGAATNATLWLTGQYHFTKRYAVLFGANITRLGDSAASSPITERREVPLLYLGLGVNL
jgi:outer membrane protein